MVCRSGARGQSNAAPEEVDAIERVVGGLLDGDVVWTNSEKNSRRLEAKDILVVAPYNAQVWELSERLGGIRVGTVDKFQGQEAPVVIYSLTTSSPEDAPRGWSFLQSQPSECRDLPRELHGYSGGKSKAIRARLPHPSPDATRECPLPIP